MSRATLVAATSRSPHPGPEHNWSRRRTLPSASPNTLSMWSETVPRIIFSSTIPPTDRGIHFDQFSLAPTPGPAVETADGSVSFTDSDPGDTHTASFTPHDNNYLGTFSLDLVSES